MSTETEQTDLERTEELFAFLQGTLPDCYKCRHMPKLTPDQAWTIIWYLRNLNWQVKDFIERCNVCGDLYDSESSGACLDYGKEPYNFCESCMASDEYGRKVKSRINPDNRKPRR